MATIRISDLSADSTPSASDVIPVDGATTRKTTLAQAVAAARPLADQAEAEAGTDTAKAMTPLTTKQAIVAIGGANFATAAQGATADTAVQPGDLSTVATSGDYDDLSNKPTLATVATSGDYDDLSNKPTLGSAAAEDTSAFATAAQGALADSAVQPAELAAVQVPTGGTTGQVLAKSSNTDNDVEWTTANAGDVLGPSSAADSELAAFDSTTGKLLKKSTVQLSEIERKTPTPPTFSYRFKEGQPLPKALSFTRASTAVRRNRAGLLESVAAETLRHHYAVDGTYLGVLIEQGATNLCLQSENLALTWTMTRATPSSNATADPFGTLWDKLVTDGTAATSHFCRQNLTPDGTSVYCISAFFKAAEIDWVAISLGSTPFGETKTAYFDVSSGTLGTVSGSGATSGIEDYGNGWYRCWIAATSVSASAGGITFFLAEADGDVTFDGDSSSGVYMGGVQFEAGVTRPTSYIPTTTVAVTRAADFLSGDKDEIGWRDSEATLYADAMSEQVPGANAALLYARETGLTGAALYCDATDVKATWRDSGTNTKSTSRTFVSGEFFKAAGTFSSSGVNVSADGSTESVSAGTQSPTVAAIWIGRGTPVGASADDQYLNGTIREFAIWDRALTAAEMAIVTTRGPAIGETLYVPETARRRYVAFSDFAPTDDTKECYPAWLAAKAEAERTGGQLVFDGPYGQTRHYRFLDRTLTGSIVVDASNIVDVAFNGGVIDCSAFALSGGRRTLFYAGGTLAGVQHSLSSSAAAGDTSVTLSSGGSSYAPGDLVFIRDDAAFTSDYANKRQEKQIVKRVVSNTIHFVGALRSAYTTGNSAQIEKINPGRTKRIVNPQVIGPGRWTGDNDGDYGIWLELLQGATVIGGKAQYADFNNFRVANCFDTEVINATSIHAYEGDGTNTKNQYGFNIQDGCEGVYYRDCHGYGGKHIFVQGVGGVAGVTRDCGWLGGSAQDSWHNAGAAHTNAERLRWEGIDISACAGGIDPRTEYATVKNNTMRNLSRSTAITVGSLGIGVTLRERLIKWIVTGNEIDGCNYGMRLGTSETIETGPGFLDLNDNTIRNAAQRAIEVYYDDTDDSKFGLSVCRNTIYGTAGVGIYTFGDFRYAVVSENTLTGGGGSACITMTGNTGQGPRSPVVENNRYQGHTAPSVSNSTGTSSVARNFEMT